MVVAPCRGIALGLLLLLHTARALPNGVGALPEMVRAVGARARRSQAYHACAGYYFATSRPPGGTADYPPLQGINSWYMIHRHLVNYVWAQPPGYCASCDVLDILAYMNAHGFRELGYSYANFDDCIVTGRTATTHELIPDALAFPEGPLIVSQQMAKLGWKMGWYTVRGATTCASGPPPRLERPGSAGFEVLDAATYASWGVTYLKDGACARVAALPTSSFLTHHHYPSTDSCGPPNTPYSVMGAALNASGAHSFYTLCAPGAGPVTALTGRATGNGWRVDEDDGGSMGGEGYGF